MSETEPAERVASPPTPAGTAVDVDALANWGGITHRSQAVDDLLTQCLNAALDEIVSRLGPWVVVSDAWPPRRDQALLILALRYYKRRQSPEGAAGFGDMGVIRITSWDSDIEAMLNNDLALAFGGAPTVTVNPL